MAEKRNKPVEELVEAAIESPQQKLENRVAVLEALLAKHIHMHYGGITPK